MTDTILNYLFFIALIAYTFRMIFNWGLLNKVEGTNYPKLFSANLEDIFLTLRHMTISALKPWWSGEELRVWKLISNIFSLALYFSLAALILTLIIGYKL